MIKIFFSPAVCLHKGCVFILVESSRIYICMPPPHKIFSPDESTMTKLKKSNWFFTQYPNAHELLNP